MRAFSDPNHTVGNPVRFVRRAYHHLLHAAEGPTVLAVSTRGPNREIVHSTRTRASQHVDHDPHDDEMVDELVDLFAANRGSSEVRGPSV